MMAPAIFKRADADQDGNLTLAELTAGGQTLFVESDKDKNATLDERELRDAINQLFPPPPQFGPPGGRPGQPGQPGGPPNAGPPNAGPPNAGPPSAGLPSAGQPAAPNPPAAPAPPPKADAPAQPK
jgi:hypothetical protein